MQVLKATSVNEHVVPETGWRVVDRTEILTGIFVLIVFACGSLLAGPIRHYAVKMVTMTFLTEFCMLFCAFPANIARENPNPTKRAVVVSLGMAAYTVVIGYALYRLQALFVLPQALTILLLRLRPREATPLFSDRNLKRFAITSVLATVLMFCQFLLVVSLTAIGSNSGLIESTPNAIAPDWVFGVAAGGYYIELAVFGAYLLGRRF